MATIATMTDDSAESDNADPQPPRARASAPQAAIVAPEQRSMQSAVLATIIAALIVGVFSFAVVGFNVMRSDIDSVRTDLRSDIDSVRTDLRSDIAAVRTDLRSEISSEIAAVRRDMDAGFTRIDERFAQIDERFAQIDERFTRVDERFTGIETVLLDHTDRLARIETVHGAHTHTTAQP